MRLNGGCLLQKIKVVLDHGAFPSTEEGKEQDMYMLGLTIFFVLTGVNLKSLPPEPKRQQFINQVLDSRELNISRELKHIIKSLTEPLTFRRLDNMQLRRLLKENEGNIIRN